MALHDRPPSKLRKRRPWWMRWLRDNLGHATTETVIMIPVLVIIWGGIYYAHHRYRNAMHNAMFVRAHVWAHAYGGCEGRGSSTPIMERPTNSDSFIDGATDLLFGSGLIPGFRINEVEGRRQRTVERPAVLGRGTTRISQDLAVMCNEVPQRDGNFFNTAWRMFFGG